MVFQTPRGVDYDQIDNWFTYHAPQPEDVIKYNTIRAAGKVLADVIFENVPAGADQSAAIRQVREAVMTANAGIACAGD